MGLMFSAFSAKFDRLTGKFFSRAESSFILYFVLVFLGTAAFLAAFGLLPNELMEQSNGNNLTQSVEQAVLGGPDQNDATAGVAGQAADGTGAADQGQYATMLQGKNGTAAVGTGSTGGSQIVVGPPSRLIIPSIGVDTQVELPASTDVDVLDHELTKGPVYYPGSGTPAGGNMFIFGHSTGYKIVINKAYRVFNDIHSLNAGDQIQVVSNGHTFEYKVKTVNKVNSDETLVKFDTASHLLTLSTCNSFGAKSDRYVVVAEYVRMD